MNKLENDIIPIKAKNNRKKIITAVVSLIIICILALSLAGLLNAFVFDYYYVDGTSMFPTLDGGSGEKNDNNQQNGELLVLNVVASIDRNDLVVFSCDWFLGEQRVLVKRVIAVGGDRISITNNIVYLNGVILNENYINAPMETDDMPERVIPYGYVFCMGDNRKLGMSHDSRYAGDVSLDDIIGKCILVVGIDDRLRIPK